MAASPTIGLKVTLIARILRTRFDARARSSGLTRAQWRTIVAIRMKEGATQSEIAARLEINSVTAGRILDRLEAAGCVERRPDPVDRRVNRVYLMPNAMPMLEKLGELGAEEEKITMRGFSVEDRLQLETLLERVIDNIQEAPIPDASVADEDLAAVV